MQFFTLSPVKFNNWIVKASIFDDQILIICFNEVKIETICSAFYCEERAHEFIETVIRRSDE